MSYTIRKKDGSLLLVLADKEVNGDYSVTLTGRNVNSYGEIQQDNMIWLTENFANSQAPSKPLEGQLWYDSSSKSLKLCTQTSPSYGWIKLLQINSSQPSKPDAGDLYYDSNSKKLYIYDSATSSWNVVGPTFDNYQKIINPPQVVTTASSPEKSISIVRTDKVSDVSGLDIPLNSVFTFTATIIARSVSMPTIYCGSWIFKGLGTCDELGNLKTVGKVDIESRLSDDAESVKWSAYYSDTSATIGTSALSFFVNGSTSQASDSVIWKMNFEAIINTTE